MKKNGFTLAEVLITLAIIGVVATLTLPALMTNTQEQQAKTALKKGINTLTEAAQMNQAIDGFDYSNLKVDNKDEESQSLYAILATRANVDFRQSGDCNATGATTDNGRVCKNGTNDGGNYVVYFRDGSSLIFPSNVTSTKGSNKSGVAPNALQDDGLVYGIGAIFDTNGSKGPNVLSNCEGTVAGVTDREKDNTQALDKVCTKKSRVIKDQFGVRLRGGYAVPNGPAARWAFNN